MKLEDIMKFVEENNENEEVKSFIEGLQQSRKLSVQDIEKLAQENSEITSWLDSVKDKHASKSLETFKTKTLPKLIDEEIKKRNPEKSDIELKLEKLEAELERERNEKKREQLSKKALSLATEKKIPTQIVDYFLGEDEETTIKNLEVFEKTMKTYVDSKVQERIKDSSYTPPSGDGDGKKVTKDDFNKMSYSERLKIKQDDSNLYEELTKN